MGSPQKIVILPGCMTHDVISHELVHAIGLYHEHQRADRDAFIDVFPEVLKSGISGALDKAPWAQFMGDYDFDSIMHYSSLGGTVNGQPMLRRKNGALIPNNTQLSAGDAAGINLLYGSQRCEV